ncbi:hypothetical protein [Flavisolibacter ginsenosidimutans]|uniref:Uncharacterized protein n=1 Tax=Flavisolibacter ginsenosidimutans TaxID=661481 RepID=A0A5B8UMU8_9BACT|nr:hypothetical protein [Flavisolibacter ginsenosidimutans]QEC57702.1 hypothetical protein FSB75_17925 [Flavisolibacter ginsenosidimutans]
MLKLCLKIWTVANLFVFVVFALLSFPHKIAMGLYAVCYSALFSLPAILLLYYLLKFLRIAHGGILFSWIVLLLGTAVVSFLSYYLYAHGMHDASGELDFVLPLSFVSGYSAVLFFSSPLHYLFQTFQYGNHEND